MVDTRKTQIPVQAHAPLVALVLKNCSTDQLEFLISVGIHHKIKSFEKLIADLKHVMAYDVLGYVAKDPTDLAMYRDTKRGEFAAFAAILAIIKAAPEELDRRKKVVIK